MTHHTTNDTKEYSLGWIVNDFFILIVCCVEQEMKENKTRETQIESQIDNGIRISKIYHFFY